MQNWLSPPLQYWDERLKIIHDKHDIDFAISNLEITDIHVLALFLELFFSHISIELSSLWKTAIFEEIAPKFHIIHKKINSK